MSERLLHFIGGGGLFIHISFKLRVIDVIFTERGLTISFITVALIISQETKVRYLIICDKSKSCFSRHIFHLCCNSFLIRQSNYIAYGTAMAMGYKDGIFKPQNPRVSRPHGRAILWQVSTISTLYCPQEICILTHCGRVTHICISKQTIICSDNGLSPGGRQAIIWTSAGIFLIGPLGTYFS